MIVEVDSRRLNGESGEIRWTLEHGEHVVAVLDRVGAARARLHATDGGKARELFEHPFALAAVPNLFERASLG